jgi:hypothetical protein
MAATLFARPGWFRFVRAARRRPQDMNHIQRDEGPPAAIPLEHEQAPLWEELQQALEREGKDDLEQLRQQVHSAEWSDRPAGIVLQRHLERADADAVIALAHRLGREWLAAG